MPIAEFHPSERLRVAAQRGRGELEIAKLHGVPGAIVRLDVLEQLVQHAESAMVDSELARQQIKAVHAALDRDGDQDARAAFAWISYNLGAAFGELRRLRAEKTARRSAFPDYDGGDQG